MKSIFIRLKETLASLNNNGEMPKTCIIYRTELEGRDLKEVVNLLEIARAQGFEQMYITGLIDGEKR